MLCVSAPGPLTLSWRVDRETVLLLGGRRALLLQLAHPLVAQGVADHSNFQNDRFGRLFRTLDLSLTIVFGEPERSAAAIEQIKAVHRVVHGTLPRDVGAYKKGTPYRADDPELLLWVHATLVETALHFYERFVAPLSPTERDDYYQDTIEPAMRIGVPDSLLPASYGGFQGYWDSVIHGKELAVGPTGLELAQAILYPSFRWFPRQLLDPLNVITVGTLPEPVRSMYGLRWNLLMDGGLKLVSATVPKVIRALPPRLRFVPHALEAERRPSLTA